MAQNNLVIYDDSVIKISINQGTEDQRVSTTLGAFTMGELACVRDNARLFVGDCQNNRKKDGDHETIGGSLAGNKYLGLVDSKSLISFDERTQPLSYENPTSYNHTAIKADGWEEKSILGKDSKWKVKFPESVDWARENSYNKEYGAYNGDFVFDAYQNAIILFDKRIGPDYSTRKIFHDADGVPHEYYTINGRNFVNDGTVTLDENGNFLSCPFFSTGYTTSSADSSSFPLETMDGCDTLEEYYNLRREALLNLKERTPLIDYTPKEGDANIDDIPINETFGQGYVVFRNVEPDNLTIRFKERNFDSVSGNNADQSNNFAHNLLEVINIPLSALEGKFNERQFHILYNVSLNEIIYDVNGIKPTSEDTPFELSPLLQLGTTIYNFTNETTKKKGEFTFVLSKAAEDEFFVDLKAVEDNVVLLSSELSTEAGFNVYRLNDGDRLTVNGLKSSEVQDPFYAGNTDMVYNGNAVYKNGVLKAIGSYDEEYKENTDVKKSIDLLETENSKRTFFKNPIAICWMNPNVNPWADGFYGATANEIVDKVDPELIYKYYSIEDKAGINAITEFALNPYVFCNRKKVTTGGTGVSFTDSKEQRPGNKATRYLWDNYFQVLGNNSHANWSDAMLSGTSDKFYIPDSKSKAEDLSSLTNTKLFKKIPALVQISEDNPLAATIATDFYEGFNATGYKYSQNNTSIVNFLVMKEVTETGYSYTMVPSSSYYEAADLSETVSDVWIESGSVLNATVSTPENPKKHILDDIIAKLKLWEVNKSGKYPYYFTLFQEENSEGRIIYEVSIMTNSSHFMAVSGENDSGSLDTPVAIGYTTVTAFMDDNDEVVSTEELTTSIDLREVFEYSMNIEGYNVSDDYTIGTVGRIIATDIAIGKTMDIDPKTVIVGDTISIQSLSAYTGYSLIFVIHQSDKEQDEEFKFQPIYTYDVYQVTDETAKLVSEKDFHLPKNFEGIELYLTKAEATDNSTHIRNVDESINDDKADAGNLNYTVPSHAQSVLLEVTHVTEDGSPIAIFSSASFGNLKHRKKQSESMSAEYNSLGERRSDSISNTRGHFGNNPWMGTTSPSYAEYTEGSFRMTIPSVLTDSNGDQNLSIFAPNEKEKCLLLSERTETVIIEVPVVFDPVSNSPKFNLRFANLKSDQAKECDLLGNITSYTKNSFFVRLVGYTA